MNFARFRFPGDRSVVFFVCLLTLPFSALALPAATDFVTTWDTTKPGSSNDSSITVPMVGGPYDVDWNNDGTIDESDLTGSVTHDFGAPGTYAIRISGTYDTIQFANGGDREKILSIDEWGTNAWTTMNTAFQGASNLEVPAGDTPDFSSVTDMFAMFEDAPLANPDTSNWDTSQVVTMARMFNGATSANPNTSNWVTANVTGMGNMFTDASSANPDTSNWTTSNVTSMSFMFAFATSANPDTSNWDTSSVTNMTGLFATATSANPDTSGWVTSNVRFMGSMFAGTELADPDVSNWDTGSVESMAGMFTNAKVANPDVGNWNTINITTFNSMFSRAEAANPDVSGWNTASVTDTAFMFYLAPNVDQDLGSWDVSSLTDARLMFDGTALSRANYESLLLGWGAQALQSSVEFHAGDATYCSADATAARDAMINDDSWIITDGGRCSLLIFEDSFGG